MTQCEKGQFVQFPVHLIYAQTELTRDDKWVLLAIMGECWGEGTYRISYREISALADVPISLLSTFTDKKTGKHHEGIINRITRVTGYISMETGKEINIATGKLKGNAQTYITINYARIWEDNRNYCEARKSRQSVSKKDYQPVSHTNKVVSHTNNPVTDTNEPVLNTNKVVLNVNKPVCDLPLEVTTYITKITEDITDKEDKDVVSPNGHHKIASLSLVSEISDSQWLSEEPMKQNGNDTHSQLSTTQPVVIPKNEDKPTKKQHDPLKVRVEEMYQAFDITFRRLMNDPLYKEPRTEKSTRAIKALIQANATPERVCFVLTDIWNDKDDFWRKHRNITSVASQYSTRVSKMKLDATSGAVMNGPQKPTARISEEQSAKNKARMRELVAAKQGKKAVGE